MRLFVSIDLDDCLKKKIALIQKQIGTDCAEINFSKPENLHFTLKFLGEVDEDKVGKIKEKIKVALSGFKRFRLSIGGIGYFGSPNFMRVIWADVNDGGEKLVIISKAMNKTLGYIREDEYEMPTPHLTIGRVKFSDNKNALLKKITELSDVKVGEMNVNVIKLKSSKLARDGPVYTDLESFNLENGV